MWKSPCGWGAGQTEKRHVCLLVCWPLFCKDYGRTQRSRRFCLKQYKICILKKNVNSSHRRRQEKPWPRLLKAGHRGRHTISNPFGPAQNLWAIGWRVKVLMKDGMVGGTMYQSLSQMACAVQRSPQSTAHCVLSTAHCALSTAELLS